MAFVGTQGGQYLVNIHSARAYLNDGDPFQLIWARRWHPPSISGSPGCATVGNMYPSQYVASPGPSLVSVPIKILSEEELLWETLPQYIVAPHPSATFSCNISLVHHRFLPYPPNSQLFVVNSNK